MKKLIAVCLTSIVGLIVTFAIGCGNSEPLVNVDKAPFEQAIVKYCKKNSYGMKIKEIISLKAKGDAATGFFRMMEASGLYGMAVKWEFQFKKNGNKWEVVSHKAR